MSPDPNLLRLHEAGVSIWLDTLSRQLLESGELAGLIRDYSVTGPTSNPTIFARAITGSNLYDEQLRALAAAGEVSLQDAFFTLALEDVRVRIDAISELPEEWRQTAINFARRTEALRRDVDGRMAPDRNEQMLLLQTLIGAWGSENLRDRLLQYMIKAAKEAKINTSWIQEDPRWEDALRSFV